VDLLLSSTALRAPAFRVVRGGATLDPSTWTRRARVGSRTITDLIDVGRVYDHLADGATIVLQGLHRYWPPVAELCRDLEAVLTHPVQANAYLTPPVAQGLEVHADAHDVFALQTHGRKQWVVYEGRGEDPTLDVTLEAGDCLYLPKGMRHAARTQEGASVHLTLGVRTVTWADVLDRALADIRADAALRTPLPAGFAHDPEALADEAHRRLAAAADRLRTAPAGPAVSQAARAFWAGRVPSLRGQLQQVLGLDGIDDGTVVARRPHRRCALRLDDGTLVVDLGDRTVRLPASAEGAMRRVAEVERFAVAALADQLDEQGRRALVRRLVREGLLVVVDG
jgi:bifunctional lysine-specific demethylase and histidyl-hydroxylase NO66